MLTLIAFRLSREILLNKLALIDYIILSAISIYNISYKAKGYLIS